MWKQFCRTFRQIALRQSNSGEVEHRSGWPLPNLCVHGADPAVQFIRVSLIVLVVRPVDMLLGGREKQREKWTLLSRDGVAQQRFRQLPQHCVRGGCPAPLKVRVSLHVLPVRPVALSPLSRWQLGPLVDELCSQE
jgi:hypothetical protein